MFNITLPTKDGGNMKVEVKTFDEWKNIVDVDKILSMMKGRQARGKRAHQYIFNEPITFDIETSSIPLDVDNNEYFNPMYVWQSTFAGEVIVGRTWDEFIRYLVFIHEALSLDENRRAIIFVHNLPYEFAWLHYRVPIKKIFARETRKPMKVELGKQLEGIEFRCSYVMTNMSLKDWAENTVSCPLQKMTGDLDYSVIRTSKTPLTNEEWGYCIADVLTMHYCLKNYIENETTKNVADLPMTSTGFVRREARNTFGREKKYRNFYLKQRLSAEQFITYNQAFRGGDTHSMAMNTGYVHDNVFSFDLTSSYPYRLIAEEFPLSKPITLWKPGLRQLNYLIKQKYLFIIDMTIIDVKLKDYSHFTYLPVSNCLNIDPRYKSDNGRVVETKGCRVVMTSADFEILIENYDFDIREINKIIYHTEKGLLPESFRNFVFKIYKMKTTLKGIEGKEDEYQRYKAMLNALYGMCVMNPLNNEIYFDFNNKEWVEDSLQIKESNEEKIQIELDKVYKSRNNFLAYTVGVWVASYARYDLHRGLNATGINSIYWDTDSVKFEGKENIKKFIQLNKDKENLLYRLGYDIEDIAPKDKEGNRHMIGLWDQEYTKHSPDGIKFKTFGSKKYFYVEGDGSNHITVAGLNKKKACKYIQDTLGEVVNIELGQLIPAEYSGRSFSVFHEDKMTVDVYGDEMTELSYMSIVPTTYELGDTNEHKLFIISAKAVKQNRR